MDDNKQKAIAEIRRVANLLGTESLTSKQFQANSTMSLTSIKRWFGSWNSAVEAAGLNPITPGHQDYSKQTLSDDALLQEIMRLSTELGKKPSENELGAFGHYSVKPYRSRWGSFSHAVEVAYSQYGDPSATTASASPPQITPSLINPVSITRDTPAIKPNAPRRRGQYGEPIDFRGLRHAPINEQGVVYLFGMVSRELGFFIESVRTAYPDCEGKRRVDKKGQLWENVLIEFEFKSSNFREHGHNPEECDLIVCWIHDYADCPLEVLELRSTIDSLQNT